MKWWIVAAIQIVLLFFGLLGMLFVMFYGGDALWSRFS